MKFIVPVILLCLLVTGMVSAKAPDMDLGVAIENPGISSAVYTQLSLTGCSDDAASTETPSDKGELDVGSVPAGASVSLDGSLWTSKHCISGWPTPICKNVPVSTPYTGRVETGSHSITIALDGYKSYSGTVSICSQKVSYVHKTLTAVPVTTVTTTTTATTSATTTAVSATTTTGTATTSPAAEATTSPTGTVPPASPTAPASLVTGTELPGGSGSLSITTTPAGAAVYIDGVLRGVSPATIPGLSTGSHTVLLKQEGYQDLAAPVSITAGTTSDFATALSPLPAGALSVPSTSESGAPAAGATPRSPGFEAAAAICAAGVLLFWKSKP